MKAARPFIVLLLAGLVGLSCSEGPSSPAPEADLIGSLLQPTGLLRCSSLPYAATTRTIGGEGGSISAGSHTLVVPPGALTGPTTITMVLPAGQNVNSVEFAPEGLEFKKPASLTMSYANCNLLGRVLPKRIAYTTADLTILYYLLSFDNLFAKRVTRRVDHFSAYAVAW